MEFRLLGPVVVLDEGGAALDIGPAQQRAVLALCMLAAPRPVSRVRIVDALWEKGPPRGAVNTVQAYISKLRRVLEPGRTRRGTPSVLVSRPGGYAIELPDEAFDLGRVRGRVAGGRRLLAAGDAAGGARELRLALTEWRGEPLSGFESEPWARDDILHLTELRMTVLEDATEADLALGLGPALVPELSRLVAAHPLRERLRRMGAHALYQAGRQADALAFLAEGRRMLVDELGLDPDPRSRELEQRILAQDPALTRRATAATAIAPTSPAPDVTAGPVSPSSASPSSASPTAGPPGESDLIGRGAELEVLRRAIAAGGHHIVLVAGEPGIGKTSLAEHAAGHAPRAVFGRCWDGTGAPPFWPWAQAVRQLTGRHGELAEITGATGEFGLYETFARIVGEYGPVLVVLDDLQWADASSLRLLEFLATTRSCPALTVVATYRDTEVGEPLARALSTLVRLPHVERIALGGLREEAIAEYLERAGADATRAADVARQTGGNPFFLGEVVHLADRKQGEDAPGAIADVLRGRMAGMPPNASDVLSAAALLGREAELEVLLDVVDVPRDEVLDVLDAAVEARLLTEHALVYRFAHDIVRDVLRDGLAPLRRRRLHARVAAALEHRGTHLAELAYHYREGLVIAGMAAKAIEYAREAARHAAAQFANEDAVEHLEQAVMLTGQLPVTDQGLRCDLLLELAEAQSAAGMSTRVHTSLDEAAEIAEALGDDERLAKAALGYFDPLAWAMYEEWAAGDALVGRIERSLLAHTGDDSPWRAQLLAASAVAGYFSRPVLESCALAADAARHARRRGDDRSLLRGLSAYEILSRGVGTHEERQVAIDELAEVARRTGDLVAEWTAREAEYFELAKQGESERADPLLTWLVETARRIRQPALMSLAAWLSATRAYMRGDLDGALAEAEESARVHPEGALGRDDAIVRARLFHCLVLRARGDAEGALRLAEEVPGSRQGQAGWRLLRCVALLDLGRRDEAAEVFAGLSADGFAGIEGDLAYRFIPDLLSEVCLELADGPAAEALYARLEPISGRLLGWSVTDLCLGRLALVWGDRDLAADRLRGALGFVRRSGAWLYEQPILELLGTAESVHDHEQEGVRRSFL
ncbi:AAA family ATPase [Planotetraspora sp. A-T 1434]|uniref:AfsR/SARP family transcriptional regulator n=1 Tax=Planotetraspora sp. A-T 1434 TaxID=2979219 RepID=UPI0021C0DE11|nr:AfsR/SARP family transcriptional regulator [Planotetraspora sp. A-T 1434]MCT9929027.1 AAA family ATPase [Planotetraspora sp. A-T 1434]